MNNQRTPTEKPVPASEGRLADLPVSSLPSKRQRTGTSRERIGAGVETREGGRPAAEGGSAPEARPAPAPAPSSSRLDTGTNCDRENPEPRDEAYRVVIRDYGDGLVEAGVTVRVPPRKRRRPEPQHQKNSEQIEDNEQRAIRRARTAIRQTIMAAKLDHMLTLTYRENQACPRKAWRDTTRFLRLVKKRTGKPFAFIAVLERQKRGAIHVHMAVHGFQDVRLLRVLWHEVIGGPEKGNVDVQFFRQNLPTLARYLCKYITKDIDTAHSAGDHRYKRSRGIVVPKVVALFPFNVAVDHELIKLFDRHKAVLKSHINRLVQEGPKWLWACSW